jgi:hypothetical protein
LRKEFLNHPSPWLSTDVSDETLLRFYEGHGRDLAETKRYLKDSAEWRESTFKIADRLKEWKADESAEARLLREWFPWGEIGRDVAGRPILLLRVSYLDFGRLAKTAGWDRMVLLHVELFERLAAASDTGDAVLLIDFDMVIDKSLPIHHIVFPKDRSLTREWVPGLIRYLTKLSKVMDVNYPESFRYIIFTRTPQPFFDRVWDAVSHFIAPRTREKIRNLRKDPDPVEAMVELGIPRDLIPDWYPSGSHDVTSKVKLGGCMPKDALEVERARVNRAPTRPAEPEPS